MKFGTGRRLADVINCDEFYLNPVRGFDPAEGRNYGIATGTR